MIYFSISMTLKVGFVSIFCTSLNVNKINHYVFFTINKVQEYENWFVHNDPSQQLAVLKTK